MKHKRIKKLLYVVIVTAFLAGCADSVSQEESIFTGSSVETEVVSSGKEESVEEMASPAVAVEVSEKKATVCYAGENFVK